MKRILERSLFWPVFVAISLAVFVFLVGTQKTYKSHTDVLIVAKNEVSAQNIEKIISDAQNISRINGINAKRLEKSGILRVFAFDSDEFVSRQTSRQASLDLAQNLARFYNIKTDINIQIINGPVAARTVRYGFLTLLVSSIVSGFLLTLSGAYVSDLFSGRFGRPIFSLSELSKRFPREKFEKKVEEEPVVAKKIKEEKITKQKDAPKETMSAIPTGKKAPAPENIPGIPDNLPIVGLSEIEKMLGKKEETAPEILEEGNMAEESAPREPTKKEVYQRLSILRSKNNPGKPTPEQAKERLNRLLNGEYE